MQKIAGDMQEIVEGVQIVEMIFGVCYKILTDIQTVVQMI